MINPKLSPKKNTDTWITPKYITEALGSFDLDPCAHTSMPWNHAAESFTIEEDGLMQEWNGRVWLNPPFSRNAKGDWMARMKTHKNGVMMIPAGFETEFFRAYVWGSATGVLVMNHRPTFHLPDGTKGSGNCGQSMCLIAYDWPNYMALLESGLGVMLIQAGPTTSPHKVNR